MSALREERLRQLAYRAWQLRGCPLGSPDIDWQVALERDRDVMDSEIANKNAEQNVDNTDDGSPTEVLSLGLDTDQRE